MGRIPAKVLGLIMLLLPPGFAKQCYVCNISGENCLGYDDCNNEDDVCMTTYDKAKGTGVKKCYTNLLPPLLKEKRCVETSPTVTTCLCSEDKCNEDLPITNCHECSWRVGNNCASEEKCLGVHCENTLCTVVESGQSYGQTMSTGGCISAKKAPSCENVTTLHPKSGMKMMCTVCLCHGEYCNKAAGPTIAKMHENQQHRLRMQQDDGGAIVQGSKVLAVIMLTILTI